MHTIETKAGLRIESVVAAELPPSDVDARARQLQHLLPRIPDTFYAALGHPRLDPAMPDQRDIYSPEAVTDMVRRSGPFQETGMECVVAVDPRAAPDAYDALKAVFVISKLERCAGDTHRTTKLEELWVEPGYRGSGVGGDLFRAGLDGVHPEDQVTLHVAEPNQKARAIYESYGFSQDPTFEPHCLGTYDVTHIRMQAAGAVVRQNLGLDS